MQLSANEPRKITNSLNKLTWDWIAASLLVACVLVASGRLVVTEATDHLFLIAFLAVLGSIVGLALGYSKFSGWLSALLGMAYGTFFVPWQLGLAVFADQEWTLRLRDLSGRLGFAIGQFASGENVEDLLMFIAAMSVLYWLLGLNAGFRTARYGDIWGSLIPFGLAALAVQSYDGRVAWRMWLLALFLLCLLLLLARMQYLQRRQDWETTRTYVPFEISGNLSAMAFGFALILVLSAWATPALTSSLDSAESFWSTITSPWRAIREELGRALFPLEGEAFRNGNVFGERFVMGRGIPQSPDILFNVQIIQQEQVPIRYYWRDRVYAYYENGNWTGPYDEAAAWTDAAGSESQTGRSQTEFLFTVRVPTDLLHSVTEPIKINRATRISFALNPDGSQDIDALFAQSSVLAGESYDLEALIAAPTANQLQDAGIAYPDWVTEMYLQLPGDFSPRMQELAETLTEDLTTPYDKTVAITSFLRAELEYVDRIPIAPFNRDPIEWAIFEQKQGFCNYYASAEVLLLRSLGIPARLAVGYAQGDRENTNGRTQYVVRERDAHAWPEVYFPGIGWVEFEPTANQDPLLRPLINPVVNEDLEHPIRPEEVFPTPEVQALEVPTSEDFPEPEEARGFLPSMIFLAGLLTLAAMLFWKRYRAVGGHTLATIAERSLLRLDIQPPQLLRNAARFSELPSLTQAYMQINEALKRLGLPPKAGDTPTQRAALLTSQLPDLHAEINTLSRDYETRIYSRSKISRNGRARLTMNRIRWATRWEQVRILVGNIRKFILKR